jgi:hypothetical protein
MSKDSFVFMDRNMIVVHFRDINGKRFHKVWRDVTEFQSFNWDEYDDDNYEILLVEWGKHCIYNALSNERICLEDLIGFFA